MVGLSLQTVYNRHIIKTQAGNDMCGIIGYLDKRGQRQRPFGQTLLSMLRALSCRGPDSAGVAIFGEKRQGWIVQLKLPNNGDLGEPINAAVDIFEAYGIKSKHRTIGPCLRFEIPNPGNPIELEQQFIHRYQGLEVVSLGHQLEIIKQVGSPAQLESTYHISEMDGTHGIGHTRLSTESRVDLSHSQPFWAHGVPDLATAHNGHITNYHKLRRQYEQRGYRFYTENDSEIIGVYLRDRLAAGMSIPDALRSSLDDFDGSFSYLAAWSDGLAFVKDRFGYKPLIVAETDEFVAIATEEIALRRAIGRDFVAREPAPGTMQVWSVPTHQSALAAGACLGVHH
jgi:glutamate synthase domain-containing protein 1